MERGPGVTMFQCKGHSGSLPKAYHGGLDNAGWGTNLQGSYFFIYPNPEQVVTPKWDFHQASIPCNNYTFIMDRGNGIMMQRCNGHP